jgi:hypothetical protein
MIFATPEPVSPNTVKSCSRSSRRRTIRENDACRSAWRKVVHNVLDPGEVRVARRRYAVFPARVFAQPVAAPIGNVEGRIAGRGED